MSVTAYHSFAGEVEASNTPTIRRLTLSRRHQLSPIAPVAVTGTTRIEVVPDIPALNEFVQGYEASSWYGVGAPASTSSEIIEKLRKDIDAAVADPNINARLIGLGLQPMSLTSAEFGKFIADETEKWARVTRAANIKAE